MPSDPVVCPVCGLVFEKRGETKAIGRGHRACLECFDEHNLSDPNERDNLLFDLAEDNES